MDPRSIDPRSINPRSIDKGLFDAGFLASLRGLRLRRRRARAADRTGDRASRGRGGRVEFSGHRNYAPGDEIRDIDWAACARLGRLYVKEYAREEADRVTVALDGSASMGCFGKWDAARRLAAAAGMLALAGGARADLVLLQGGAARRVAALRGRQGMPRLLDALSGLEARGPADLPRALLALPRPAGRGAVLVLVSDLLDPGDIGPPLAARAARGEEPVLLEVLAPEERLPRARGTLVLRDPERPGEPSLRLAVGEREARAFGAEVRRRLEEHGALARRLRGTWILARTEVPAGEVLRPLAATGGGRR
jgi:uncharacterized protein (DUF58 family)